MLNPIVQGWINYYGLLYKSMLYPVLRRINDYLVRACATEFLVVRVLASEACRWSAQAQRSVAG